MLVAVMEAVVVAVLVVVPLAVPVAVVEGVALGIKNRRITCKEEIQQRKQRRCTSEVSAGLLNQHQRRRLRKQGTA